MKNQLIFPKAVFAGKSGENSVSLVDAARFPVAEVARLRRLFSLCLLFDFSFSLSSPTRQRGYER